MTIALHRSIRQTALIIRMKTPFLQLLLSSLWLIAGVYAIHAEIVISLVRYRIASPQCFSQVPIYDWAAALAEARQLRKVSPNQAIVIDVPAGTSFVADTIRIGSGDSGTDNAPLILRGAPDGSTHLSGSLPLLNITSSPLQGGKLRLADLSECPTPLPPSIVSRGLFRGVPSSAFELFQGEKRLYPSRWPRSGYFTGSTLISQGSGPTGPTITLPKDKFAQWKDDASIQFAGYWAYDWAFETLRMLAFDQNSDAVTLEHPMTPFAVRQRFRYFAFNINTEVTDPGSYALDAEKKTVIFVPLAGRDPVERSRTVTLIQLNAVHDVNIERLAFEKTLGTPIRIANSDNINLTDCFAGHSGSRGIEINNGSHVTVERCVVSDTAETAVYVAGGDRPSLTSSGHVISDNSITYFGVESMTYRPGVEVAGVGVNIHGNFIAHGPHAGMIMSGNDHIVHGNELMDLVTDSNDAGAIYMGRDWTARGNEISVNYIHEVGRNADKSTFISGIYLDDEISGVRIEGNRFENVSRPVVIGGGRDNFVVGNTIASAGQGAVYIDNRGETWQHDMVVDGVLRRNLQAMPILSPNWSSRYPKLTPLYTDISGVPSGNCVTNNSILDDSKLLVLEGLSDPMVAQDGCPGGAVAPKQSSAGRVTRQPDAGQLLYAGTATSK